MEQKSVVNCMTMFDYWLQDSHNLIELFQKRGNQYFVEQFIDQNLDIRPNLEADHNQSFVAYQSLERENQPIKSRVMNFHQNSDNLHLRLIEPRRKLDIPLQDCGPQLLVLLPL